VDKLIIFEVSIGLQHIEPGHQNNYMKENVEYFSRFVNPDGYNICHYCVPNLENEKTSIKLLYPPNISFLTAKDMLDLEANYTNIPGEILDQIKKEIYENV
jgi:hypothetical protein